jgi:DNA-binding NtrC family response regulator
MKASHFFLMLEESNYIQGAHYSHLSDIQAISITKSDWYYDLKNRYNHLMGNVPQLPERPEDIPNLRPVFRGDSVEAKTIMKKMISTIKREMMH